MSDPYMSPSPGESPYTNPYNQQYSTTQANQTGPSPYSPGTYSSAPAGPMPPYAQAPYQNGQPGRYGNMQQMPMGARNGRAQRAMIYGFISVALSIFTLLNVFGYAGLVTGIFAIIYGVQGLRIAGRFPNQAGKGQSITAIVLGAVAIVFVLLAFALRASMDA